MKPVTVEGWETESRDRLVGAVDGDAVRPVSTFNPAVSHIEGGCVEVPLKKGGSMGLTVWLR